MRRKKAEDDGPSLFDEVDAPSEPTEPADVNAESEWQEVPQERYLSWTKCEQYRYCAARDYDAAVYADTADESEWFIARAKMYEEMIA